MSEKNPKPPSVAVERELIAYYLQGVRSPAGLAEHLGISTTAARRILLREDIRGQIARMTPSGYRDPVQAAAQAAQDDANARARAEQTLVARDVAIARLLAELPTMTGPALVAAVKALSLAEHYKVQRDASGRPLGTDDASAREGAAAFQKLVDEFVERDDDGGSDLEAEDGTPGPADGGGCAPPVGA